MQKSFGLGFKVTKKYCQDEKRTYMWTTIYIDVYLLIWKWELHLNYRKEPIEKDCW